MIYLTENEIERMIQRHKELIQKLNGEMTPTVILFTDEGIKFALFQAPLRPHDQIFLLVDKWKPNEMLYASTAWMAILDPNEVNSYEIGDLSQRPNRQEIIMLIFVNFPKHEIKWRTIPYYREQGHILFDEVIQNMQLKDGDIPEMIFRCFQAFYPKVKQK